MQGINSRAPESVLVWKMSGSVSDQQPYLPEGARACARKATSSQSYQILQGKRAVFANAR